MGQMVKAERGLTLSGFTLSETGLEPAGRPSFEEWQVAGRSLRLLGGAANWWIGDWLNYGDLTFGEMASQELQNFAGFGYDMVRKVKWVSAKVKLCNRLHNLPWTHHHAVAALSGDEQRLWLQKAKDGEWSVKELESAIRAERNGAAPVEDGCEVKDLQKLIDLGKTFGAIYADPPWDYGNQRTRAATGNHYGTMPVEEIAALPVPQLASEECHLHLWTTEGFLEEGIALLKGWGFERKSGFVWVKPQLGIGNYWRVSHEFMLLGVKGGKTFPPSDIKSWIHHDRTEHSAKPEEVRRLIEKVSPGPRLELFARNCVPGWTVWGNQIERGMFDNDIKEL